MMGTEFERPEELQKHPRETKTNLELRLSMRVVRLEGSMPLVRSLKIQRLVRPKGQRDCLLAHAVVSHYMTDDGIFTTWASSPHYLDHGFFSPGHLAGVVSKAAGARGMPSNPRGWQLK